MKEWAETHRSRPGVYFRGTVICYEPDYHTVEGTHFYPVDSGVSAFEGVPPSFEGYEDQPNHFVLTCDDMGCMGGFAALTCTSIQEMWTNGDTSIRKIGSFRNSFGLKRVSFPEVVDMDAQCFSQCGDLTSISLPSLSSDYGLNGNGLGCSSLVELHVESLPISAIQAHGKDSGSSWHGMPVGVCCFCKDGIYVVEY